MIPGYTTQQLAKIVQRSPEWLEAHKGCIGSSGIKEATGVRKRGDAELESRRKYKLQIVAERLGSWLTEHYVSDPMIWGIENEPLARTAYELRYGVDVDLVGIVAHPTIDMTLCSPDGLVSTEGLVEFKCPNTDTHFDYMDRGGLPKEYEPQVQWQLACNPDRQWCDFVSFDPRVAERNQLFRFRVERDSSRIAELEAGAVSFLSEVSALLLRLEQATNDYTPPLVRQQLAESLSLTGDFYADRDATADALFGEYVP